MAPILISAAAGSALGGILRHAVASWITLRSDSNVPFGTLAVNVSGSAAIGLAASFPWAAAFGPSLADFLSVFLIYGILGGYTTVSAYSVQCLALLQTGHYRTALAYIALSGGFCLAAAYLGYRMGAVLFLPMGGTP